MLVAAPGDAYAATGLSGPAQPYLAAIGRPSTMPPLEQVRVAIVDTGVDGRHPDLTGRIVAARTFGGGDPLYPASPHGTAVAGLIGAIDDNPEGIDGIAPNARLLVADVAHRDSQTFDPNSIATAIRWAADRHARVINLSLSGPGPDPEYDRAVAYALSRGALVVAAAGNCYDGKFLRCTPRGTTLAPAWMPHVLTVGATNGARSAARFSVPSARWVDVAAPGQLVTTLWPTRNNPYFSTPDCAFAGTTSCYSTGGADSVAWGPSGTSFAAPMVSAAAAILFGADPQLQPGQVTALLEQTAHAIADPRHQLGAGVIDIAAALTRVRSGSVPPPDHGEPNDTTADAAAISRARVIRATLDWSDDPADVYRLALVRGDRLRVDSRGKVPGRVSIVGPTGRESLVSGKIGRRVRYVAAHTGTYFLRLAPTAGRRGPYRLAIGVN